MGWRVLGLNEGLKHAVTHLYIHTSYQISCAHTHTHTPHTLTHTHTHTPSVHTDALPTVSMTSTPPHNTMDTPTQGPPHWTLDQQAPPMQPVVQEEWASVVGLNEWCATRCTLQVDCSQLHGEQETQPTEMQSTGCEAMEAAVAQFAWRYEEHAVDTPHKVCVCVCV